MKVIKTTDNRHLGVNIDEPNVGESLLVGDFVFVVQGKILTDNDTIVLFNPNYQIELEK